MLTIPGTSALFLWPLVLLSAGPAAVSVVRAQGFADDFSRNSLHYTLERHESGSGLGQAVEGDQGLFLSARVVDGDRDDLRLSIAGQTDHVVAQVALERASLVSRTQGRAGVRLEGNFYNDTAAPSAPGVATGAEGDVYFSLELFAEANGVRGGRVCASRIDMSGEATPLGLFSEPFCEALDGFVPAFGVGYRLALTLDRDAGTMTAEIDGLARVYPLSTPVHQAHGAAKYLEAFVEGGAGEAVIEISGVETDDIGDDFTVEMPVFPGYRAFRNLDRPLERYLHDNGEEQATLSVAVPAGADYNEIRLGVWNVVDHLQARLMLSSESIIEADSSIGAGLQGSFYRDSPAGQVSDEAEMSGIVQAQLILSQTGGPSAAGAHAEYCLWRQTGASFESFEPLLDPERRCLDLGISPRMDVSYPAVLSLDRDAGVMIFGLGDVTRVHNIATPVHDASDAQYEVVLYAQGDARGIAYLDDLRTANGALTSAESGLEIVPYIRDPIVGEGGGEPLDDGVIVLPPDTAPGSAGGCSAGGIREDRQPLLSLLAGVAMLILVRRTRVRHRLRD